MRRILLIEKDKSIVLCVFQAACDMVWSRLPLGAMPQILGV